MTVAFTGRDFFDRDTVTVARELIGARVCLDGDTVVARLVEVEAYLGEDDLASHAYRGLTPRSQIMFGEPGHLYVYFVYGMHHCANLVTEARGKAGAVLLRAAAVEQGADTIRSRRAATGGQIADDRLLSGPGNFCRGLGITRDDNGLDVCSVGARLRVIPADDVPNIATAPRIGIRHNTEAALRFCLAGHPAISIPI